MSSVNSALGWAFCAATAAIWVSAGSAKMFFTHRAAQAVEAKGWAPMKNMPPRQPASSTLVSARLDVVEDHALTDSTSLLYALCGTIAAGVTFYALKP
jgi:hypothetical protein